MKYDGPILIGIAGGSGSGKSTIAAALRERLDAPSVIVETDWYYRDLSHLSRAEREAWNFDHPDALDWPFLIEQLTILRQGVRIDRPVYDFRTHTRSAGRVPVEPHAYILVEGIFALHGEELAALYDLSVYVEAPEEIRFSRRLQRDVEQRGRTPESVQDQFARTVRPMHTAFVEPCARRAHVTADGRRAPHETVLEILERLPAPAK